MREKKDEERIEQGGFRMAWIGLLDPHTRQVKPTAHGGQADDSLEKLNITLDNNEVKGNNLCSPYLRLAIEKAQTTRYNMAHENQNR